MSNQKFVFVLTAYNPVYDYDSMVGVYSNIDLAIKKVIDMSLCTSLALDTLQAFVDVKDEATKQCVEHVFQMMFDEEDVSEERFMSLKHLLPNLPNDSNMDDDDLYYQFLGVVEEWSKLFQNEGFDLDCVCVSVSSADRANYIRNMLSGVREKYRQFYIKDDQVDIVLDSEGDLFPQIQKRYPNIEIIGVCNRNKIFIELPTINNEECSVDDNTTYSIVVKTLDGQV